MKTISLPVFLIWFLAVVSCGQTSTSKPTLTQTKDSVYQYRNASQDGIGKVYMGREIAQVMGHLGAEWLERPEREQEERTDLLLKLLRLKPTDVVADIGAGTGYFSFRLAPELRQGKVLAVDIQQEMIDLLNQAKQKNKSTNVEAVLGTISDPKLPPNSVDMALMVDAYHEFSHPYEMMRNIAKALKPNGRVILVEYRAEDPSVPIKTLHKMSVAQAKKELQAVGLQFDTVYKELPQQHVLVFSKRAAAN